MALNTKDFVTLVRDQVTAIQGSAAKLIDFSIGSVLRAIVEANAGVVLWLQGLILQLLATTRASTSAGSDLDSFVADFGLTRLPAASATGSVTFQRASTATAAFVPVGTIIKTSDQTPEKFQVTQDTTNAAWSPYPNAATGGGYTIGTGVASLTLPVQALVPGSGSNVLAGQCNMLAYPIPGVDTVSNANPFTSGVDAETDAALRTRFVSYLASLSRATKTAIANAITSVQPNLTFTVTENPLANGVPQYGYFAVVVDDGSGAPSSQLLQAVSSAIDAVRPITSTFGVVGPYKLNAVVNLTITTPAASHATLTAQVAAALVAYINSLPLGQSLPYTRLAQVAYDTSPLVTNVTGVSLSTNNGVSNGITYGSVNAGGDLTVTPQVVIRASTATVTVN